MSQLIVRNGALRRCESFAHSECRVLFVQAQAGQGKTILATQFAGRSPAPFAWATCTGRDRSPAALFLKVLDGLDQVLDGFSGEPVAAALRQPMSADEFVAVAPLRLAGELRRWTRPVCLVIDDAHLLEASPSSKRLLLGLVRTLPRNFRFLVVGRFGLTLDDGPLLAGVPSMTIGRAELAFDRAEIAALYNDILHVPANTRKVDRLLEATEGWVAGLVLLCTARGTQRLARADQLRAMGIFFDGLVKPALDSAERRELYCWALLDGLPEGLVGRLAPPRVAAWLHDMAERNCFVRTGNEGGERLFRLHHLFRDYLTWQGENRLAPGERRAFLLRAGRAQLADGRVLDGLDCLVRSGEWTAVSDALREHCMPLLAANAQQALMDILSDIPESVCRDHAWICFALGATRLTLAPADSAPVLLRARERFAAEGEAVGELLASCSLLNFHVIISGEYGRKGSLIARTATLFNRLLPELSPDLVPSCAQALTLAMVYCQSDLRRANAFARLAGEPRGDGTGTDPWLLITRLVIAGMLGRVEAALDLLAPWLKVVNTPWIAPTTRFSLVIIEINYLLMAGRFAEYRLELEWLRRHWGAILEQSYLSGFLTVWDLDLLLREGRYEAMLRLLRDQHPAYPESAHIASQLAHYEMLALAHLGRFREMDRVLPRALRLRARAGGPYFLHLTRSYVMGALYLAGRDRAAERVYAKCLVSFADAATLYHMPVVHAYRAARCLRRGETETAREETDRLLGAMERSGNAHFFGWSPPVMEPVLAFAVREGIHPACARRLADGMGLDILDDGTVVRRLSVTVLGTDRADLGGDASSGADPTSAPDLPPGAATLLRLLALAPGHTLAVRDLRAGLWPAADPAEAEARLDGLLADLRDRPTGTAEGDTFGRHLARRGERLSLEHVAVDADAAARLAAEGLNATRAGLSWRAHNVFRHLARCLGPALDDPARLGELPSSLTGAVREALAAWARVLRASGASEAALDAADRGLALAPADDALQRERCVLLRELRRPDEAARAGERYRTLLAARGVPEAEIGRLAAELVAPAGE